MKSIFSRLEFMIRCRITILDKMKTSDISYRKETERYLINKFNTYYEGISRMPWKALSTVRNCKANSS